MTPFLHRYNEIWPTGGWGSIEYGGKTAGQVPGGRWKPMQYLLKASAYANQFAHCALDGVCFLRQDDGARPFVGTVVVEVTRLRTGRRRVVRRMRVSVPRGPAVTRWFCAFPLWSSPSPSLSVASSAAESSALSLGRPRPSCDSFHSRLRWIGCAKDGSDCVLSVKVTQRRGGQQSEEGQQQGEQGKQGDGFEDADAAAAAAATNGAKSGLAEDVISTNINLFVPPKNLTHLPNTVIRFTVGALRTMDGKRGERQSSVPITLHATKTALYVTLTTLSPGRFSDNAFLLHEREDVVVEFMPWGGGGDGGDGATAEFDPNVLAATLRVESLAMYMDV